MDGDQFFRIAGGKVVEHWVDVDLFGWFSGSVSFKMG
jgi:hypothetical protein